MRDVADEADRGRPPIRKHQKNRTARRWFFAAISVWVVIVRRSPL